MPWTNDPGALAKAETSWREYLRAHAAEIDAGKKLDATQASVDMFPGGNYVHLLAGGTYPPGRGK